MRLCGGMPGLPGNRSIVSYEIATVHPPSVTFGDTPPTRREAAPRKFLRIKFVGVPPPLQAPSLASLKSHFHPQIVSLTFKVPSLFGGADVLIYRHKVRRGRGADAGERSPDEPTAHPRDRPLSGVFIDVFSFLFLVSGGRVSSLPPIFCTKNQPV